MILNLKDFELLETNKSELIKLADSSRYEKSLKIKVTFDGATLKKDVLTIKFESIDLEGIAGHSWSQIIKMEDLDISNNLTKKDLKNILLKSQIKVNCDCKDFLYKGYKYIGTQKGYSIENEYIKPDIKNPNLEGTVCKHLLAVLSKLDKYTTKIHEDIK